MAFTKRKQVATGELQEVSILLMKKLVKSANTIIDREGLEPIFNNDNLKAQKTIVLKAVDCAKDFSSKSIVQQVEGDLKVGAEAFIKNILDKIGPGEAK